MDQAEMHNLARTITEKREMAGLTYAELARRTGTAQSTIMRIETEQIQPKVETVVAIARELDIPVSDLFTTADWLPKDELPSFTPYLRSKYRDMPLEARKEIEQSFGEIAKKYGYDGSGPLPGEDET